MNDQISVVIPYYQREPEPLKLAIHSVLQQIGVQTPEIIVVDDGSPIPAKSVISQHFAGHSRIRILEQPNAGAAQARNTGMAAVNPQAEFIAFIDSDDQWSSQHLQSAISALAKDGDLYFADHRRTNWPESKFTSIESQVEELTPIDSKERINRLSGNVIRKVLQLHMISTSSVVIRRSRLGHLRFRRDLVLGEDEVLWIEAIRNSRNTYFSKDLEVIAGPGSVSQNQTGDISQELKLAARNIYFWHRIRHYLPNEPDLASLRDQRLRDLECGFASLSLSAFGRRRSASTRDLVQVTSSRPRWLVSLIVLLWRKLLGAFVTRGSETL